MKNAVIGVTTAIGIVAAVPVVVCLLVRWVMFIVPFVMHF